MNTLTHRLAHLASTTLVLLLLIVALFALGVHVRAASHANVSVNAHQMLAAVDPPPPGH
ncbi:MAG TPA: hypothetical protein VH540_25715 [Ktedonobacterales bacterium]